MKSENMEEKFKGRKFEIKLIVPYLFLLPQLEVTALQVRLLPMDLKKF